MIATCGVYALITEAVPLTWVQQTRPGGTIMANLPGPVMLGALTLIEVHGDGTASGPFLPGYASFMALRHDPAVLFDHTATTPLADKAAVDRTTAVGPAWLRDNDAWGFFARLHLPGIQARTTTGNTAVSRVQ
ncbi:MAG: hypothetical protein ACRDQ5_18975 [Sciscionella sp.]